MLQKLAYRYHRFLGIMFITVVGTGLMKVDFSKTQINKSETSSMLLKEGELSLLKKANGWLNSPPLSASDLKGKVVLIQFGTYTCINWIRTLPYVRAWVEKYKEKGLAVIVVHTPEFTFEKSIDNIRRSINDMKIDFPIAIDNNYAIWEGFNNHYWPAFYFIDAKGKIRHQQFGEGEYEQSEKIIQQLLTEAGAQDVRYDPVTVNAMGAEVDADWSNLKSFENYLGYERTQNFVNGGWKYNKQHDYNEPADLRLNHWGLSGSWTVQKQSITVNKANGKIGYRFHARDLHLVMGPSTAGTSIPFRVLINGKAPGDAHGVDVDKQGYGKVGEPRMYQLIRQSNTISDLLFEIEFFESGVEVFAFTFG